MYAPWGRSYDRNISERFKCLNVNFRLLKTIYLHLLVCCLNKLQNARCNDKDCSHICAITFFSLNKRSQFTFSKTIAKFSYVLRSQIHLATNFFIFGIWKRWAGHVARIGDRRDAWRVLFERPEGKRPVWITGVDGADNINIDLQLVVLVGMD